MEKSGLPDKLLKMKSKASIIILLSFLCICQNKPEISEGQTAVSRSEILQVILEKRGDKTVKQTRSISGVLKWEVEMSEKNNGKLIADGYMKEFFENGNVKKLSYFKMGVQDSVCIEYYQNGAKHIQYWFANGRQTGKKVYFDSTGNRIR